jgi:UDP-glucose 4-epimerase
MANAATKTVLVTREGRAISARTPARFWRRKAISPLLSTICRRCTRGLPNGGLSKGEQSSIGLLNAIEMHRPSACLHFAAFAYDLDVEIGEDHDPETHLVPLVLNAACGDCEAITGFGTVSETHDGTCVRDYIHVTDLAKAHGLMHRAFNLGNGHGYSVREVIVSVDRVTGRHLPVRFGEKRPRGSHTTDQQFHACGKRVAMEAAHYKLDDTISTAWEWHKRKAHEKGRR